MLIAMPWGSSRRKPAPRSGGALPLLAIGGLVVAALAFSAIRPDSDRPGGMVILYGDSLSLESSTYFTEEMARISSALVITKPVPGSAPCDALETMRADATLQPSVVVIQYVGNNGTDCTRAAAGGERQTGQALADRYAADVRAAADIFAGDGTRVVLVGGPVAPGLPGGAEDEIAAAYQQIVAEWDGRAYGMVRYADAAGTVTGPGHAYAERLPCADDEGPGQGCGGGEVRVRSPDLAHFCPAEGAYLVCPVPSPGARRFGQEMARVAREAMDD
jgi:hypothetical protein